MVVVCLAPLGPNNPKRCPRITSSWRPSTATTSANDLRRPRIRRDGPLFGAPGAVDGTAASTESWFCISTEVYAARLRSEVEMDARPESSWQIGRQENWFAKWLKCAHYAHQVSS